MHAFDHYKETLYDGLGSAVTKAVGWFVLR